MLAHHRAVHIPDPPKRMSERVQWGAPQGHGAGPKKPRVKGTIRRGPRRG